MKTKPNHLFSLLHTPILASNSSFDGLWTLKESVNLSYPSELGLSPAAVSQILNKTEKTGYQALAEVNTFGISSKTVGAEVQFDTPRKQFVAGPEIYQLPDDWTQRKSGPPLCRRSATGSLSRKKRITREERERIVRVVKAVSPVRG